ncbi:MAG: hypothetical protein HYV33_00505 [Candidatus Kerfeldbacteria bacterium]|nr:hypothetical protein [Candidatus Kerfeldbacteria bacterium]
MRQTSSARITKIPAKKTDTLLIITYGCVVLAAVLAVIKLGLLTFYPRTIIDQSTYQAVALDNGQTFFGKLTKLNVDTYVLVDVYYLQTSNSTPTNDPSDQTADATTEPKTDIKLVPLTSDLHQPYNHMIINVEHVVFWQNLRPESPVITAIEQQ